MAYKNSILAACALAMLAAGAARAGGFEDEQQRKDHAEAVDKQHAKDRDNAHANDRMRAQDRDRMHQADRMHATDRDHARMADAGRRDPAWSQNRGSWHAAHAGWDRGGIWHSGGAGWWHHDPHFSGFVGVRVGFYFAPGFGYYSVPPQYYGHYWHTGEYVPNVFWRYTINDYGYYGLQPPPYGCAWVWLNGSIALVDMSDGYVIDIVDHVY